MKKLNKFFITALVAGLVAFSSALAIPTQMAQALIKTEQIENNAITSPKIKDGEVKTPDLGTGAVTKEKLNPNAVKLVKIERENEATVQRDDRTTIHVDCSPNEIATGGGYFAPVPVGAIPELFITRTNAEGNGWTIDVVNFGNSADVPVRVFAECAHLELGP
jgi:hypothetical protein